MKSFSFTPPETTPNFKSSTSSSWRGIHYFWSRVVWEKSLYKVYFISNDPSRSAPPMRNCPGNSTLWLCFSTHKGESEFCPSLCLQQLTKCVLIKHVDYRLGPSYKKDSQSHFRLWVLKLSFSGFLISHLNTVGKM